MKTHSSIATLTLALALAPLAASAQQKDLKGCEDYPLFTRMPGYWIQNCSARAYDERVFQVEDAKKETVGGRFVMVRYSPLSTNKEPASAIQVFRNFENATAKLGGKVLAGTNNRRTIRVAKDGKEFWVDLWADHTGKYGFEVIERQEMAQDIEANAELFSNDLKATGRTAVYGIYFDTGKAEIKPESAQAIGEIAKLLKGDPSLKIYVVGHTDNVGTLDANMRLSHDRADSVVQALIKTQGIAAARLKAFGAGPYSPVASNDAETGRAKNRRVELVKQ